MANKTDKKAPMTIQEMQEKVVALRNELAEAKRNHQMGELVNPKSLNTKRKEIARLLTNIKLTVQSDKEEK